MSCPWTVSPGPPMAWRVSGDGLCRCSGHARCAGCVRSDRCGADLAGVGPRVADGGGKVYVSSGANQLRCRRCTLEYGQFRLAETAKVGFCCPKRIVSRRKQRVEQMAALSLQNRSTPTLAPPLTGYPVASIIRPAIPEQSCELAIGSTYHSPRRTSKSHPGGAPDSV